MKPAAAGAAPKAMVLSSPGRAEKLPAPGLARLLRGKGGSRSRGRGSLSRSSPMFVTRSKSVGRSSSAMETTAEEDEEEGEPSSPKVTCIGQVRIRSKNKSKSNSRSKKSKGVGEKKMRCLWLERALICNLFAGKNSSKSGRPRRSLWGSWAILSVRFGGKGSGSISSYQKEPDPATKPLPEALIKEVESDREESEDESEEEEEEEETKVFVSSATTTPPKNALLLMRCRSAPHNRSSALATTRFSVSPLPGSSENKTPEREKIEGGGGGGGGMEEEEEVGESCNGSAMGSGDSEEVRCSSASTSGPMALTRCKSEPAKKAAKMVVPEATYCLWNNSSSSSTRRRLALVKEEEGPPPLLLQSPLK